MAYSSRAQNSVPPTMTSLFHVCSEVVMNIPTNFRTTSIADLKSLHKADLRTGLVTTKFPVPPTLFMVLKTTNHGHDSRLVGTSLESWPPNPKEYPTRLKKELLAIYLRVSSNLWSIGKELFLLHCATIDKENENRLMSSFHYWRTWSLCINFTKEKTF